MNIDSRLLRRAWESRLGLVLTLGLALAAGVLTVLQAGNLSRVISQVFLAGASLTEVAGRLYLILGIILLRAAAIWGSEASAATIACQVKTVLREQVFRHILKLGPLYARGEKTGELVNTLTEGIDALEAYLSQYLPQLALAALVPFTFLLFIFPLDPLSGLVLLVTAPLIPLFMVLIGNLAQALTRKQWQTLSRLSAYFLDVLQGLSTLKSLGRSRAQIGVIAKASQRYRQVTMEVLRVTFLSALALEMIATLSTAMIAVEVGLRLLYGHLEFEQAFFVLLLAPEFYLPLRTLGARFHAGMSGITAATRLFQVIETPLTTRQDPNPAEINQSEQSTRVGIEFSGVHYRYPEGAAALNGVSFQVPTGQVVAVVGRSGSGKTTLANLVLGFASPDQGEILVNGVPVTRIPPETLHFQIAYVPQNPFLFYGTVADNIRLARPEASQQAVEQAAQLAVADAFIQQLPQGYDTLIGERGARLSAGQAQRLALARAFLQDAPLLILDEPTAHLDPASEAQVQEALNRLLVGRTALIIAHRLTTIATADQILVLDKGLVVQRGDHRSLLSEDGLYRELVFAYQASLQESTAISQPVGSQPVVTQPGITIDNSIAPPQDTALSPIPPGPTAPALPRARKNLELFLALVSLAAPYKSLIALAVLASLATVASGVGLMSTSAYILAAAALHPSIADLQVAIVGVRFFGIARGLFRYCERYLSHQVTFHLLERLRVTFYQALEPLAPARLSAYHSGDLLARILNDIGSLEFFYVRVLAPPITAVLAAGLACGYLTWYDGRLGLFLLATLLSAGVGIPILAHWLSRNLGERTITLQAELRTSLVDGLQGMPDLLACNQAGRQLERVARQSAELIHLQSRLARISAVQSSLLNLLASLAAWGTLILAIPLVSSGHIPGTHLAVLMLAALTSFEAVLPLPLAAQFLETNLAAARRLFEITDSSPAVVDRPDPLPLPERYTLQVNQLSFHYPDVTDNATDASRRALNGRRYALQEITFSLCAGDKLAIVGASGAGKTTLVNLLLRFWDFQAGEIRLGGQDIRNLAQEALRGRISVVGQNAFIFSATVRENLLIARPQAMQADLIAAARQAQIHDVIETLPQGYDTWIGDQGLRLSGGERQRLAIARAFLRDTPLLILDEATANLDALTEQSVWQALETLAAGRTTLVITHRLIGMEKMNEILVLDHGRIVEQGRHTQLLYQQGSYYKMWTLQHEVLD